MGAKGTPSFRVAKGTPSFKVAKGGSKGDTQLHKLDTATGSEPVEPICSVPRQPPCKKRPWAISLPAVMRDPCARRISPGVFRRAPPAPMSLSKRSSAIATLSPVSPAPDEADRGRDRRCRRPPAQIRT
jgi:hypothetical protein